MLINQQILAKPGWLQKMAPKDFRGLLSLIYHYVEIHALTRHKYELTITDRKALGGIIIDYTLYEKPKYFLTEAEMDRFLHAAKSSRYGVRDHLMMLLIKTKKSTCSARGQSSMVLPIERLIGITLEVVPTTLKRNRAMSHFRKLSHSIWHCQYHIVWVPKYRFRILTGRVSEEVNRCIRGIIGRR